jgi:hypothetical protein
MTKSAGNPEWRRSKDCGNATCIEVAKVDDQYLIRDSKSPESAPLIFTADEWLAFVSGVKRNDFRFE